MTDSKNPRTIRFLWFIGILAFAGLIVRIAVSSELIRGDSFVFAPPPETDAATYQTLSDAILHGKIPEVFYYQPFYYSVFLPVVKFISRSPLWGPALGQSICGFFIIFYSGLSAALLRGRKAGVFASFFAAFSTLLIFYVPYALLEIQQCLWFTLLFYFMLRLWKTGKIRFYAGTGLVLSFAILSRGNAWCFLPVLLLAFYYSAKKNSTELRRNLLRAGIFFLCLILPQIPFLLQNSIHEGKLTGPSTAGSAVLALGNNPEAPPGGLEYPETYEFWMAHQKEISIPQRIFTWAKQEPGAFLELQFRKFLLFFHAGEIPNNVSLEYNGERSSILRTVRFIPTGWILVFALTGFFLLCRSLLRKKGLQLCYLFLLSYAGAAAAFYILARFRVPALGIFCTAAGFLPAMALDRYRRGEIKRVLIPFGGALAGAAALVYLIWPAWSSYYECRIQKFLRPGGVLLQRSDTETDVIDSGPMNSGGWTAMSIKNDLIIEKKFAIPSGFENADAKLVINIMTMKREKFSMRINQGEWEKLSIGTRPAGTPEFTKIVTNNFKIPLDSTFRITFSGVTNDSTAQVILDLQRDFGRTKINSQPFPGEAAIRLKLTKK